MSRQRAYATGYQITLGMVNVPIDLVPVRRSEANKAKQFKIIAPEDVFPEPTPMEIRYVVPGQEHLGMWTQSECDRGKEIEGSDGSKTIVRASDEERSAVISGDEATRLPDGVLELHIFPAEDIDAATVPNMKDGGMYRLRPPAKKGKWVAPQSYLMLRDLIKSMPEKAFIGEISIREIPRLARLSVWNDQIVLTELVRPSQVAPVDEIDGEYNAALLAKAAELVNALVEDFDPDMFASQIEERAKAFAAAKLAEQGDIATPVQIPAPAKVADPSDALLAMLDTAVSAARGKKVA